MNKTYKEGDPHPKHSDAKYYRGAWISKYELQYSNFKYFVLSREDSISYYLHKDFKEYDWLPEHNATALFDNLADAQFAVRMFTKRKGLNGN